MADLEGGKFGNGFFSAGVAEAAGPGIEQLDPENPVGKAVSAQRVVAAAIVGGTTSAISGGKFANGAATAPMGRLTDANVAGMMGHELVHVSDFSYYGMAPTDRNLCKSEVDAWQFMEIYNSHYQYNLRGWPGFIDWSIRHYQSCYSANATKC